MEGGLVRVVVDRSKSKPKRTYLITLMFIRLHEKKICRHSYNLNISVIRWARLDYDESTLRCPPQNVKTDVASVMATVPVGLLIAIKLKNYGPLTYDSSRKMFKKSKCQQTQLLQSSSSLLHNVKYTHYTHFCVDDVNEGVQLNSVLNRPINTFQRIFKITKKIIIKIREIQTHSENLSFIRFCCYYTIFTLLHNNLRGTLLPLNKKKKKETKKKRKMTKKKRTILMFDFNKAFLMNYNKRFIFIYFVYEKRILFFIHNVFRSFFCALI